MRTMSPNNPVRRCLFPVDDLTEQAKIDNFANVLRESIARDREEKKRKFNFDFENEVPLDGVYEWYRTDGVNDWIAVKKDPCTDVIKEKPDALKQLENESTPRTNKDEKMPLLRKRRKSLGLVDDKGVRRKISFD
uniref:Cyclin-dependent kinase inhibitor domain-containing protein n=1 Tax=Bombyx mori TaxID=7091 RepID=A0A8R2C9D9_BOMMO|nr:uncharacterized protein LOC101739571 [Bombyx mori]XP_012551815.1 uncharacterized protein LOC101739571 [Bombyx mori]XP_037871267.1 uncharacterized protein LOC101739571 [Bombyx mori]